MEVGVDQLQSLYDDALARVLRDLPAGLVDATIIVDFTEECAQYRFVSRDGGEHGRDLPRTLDLEVAAVGLADRLQDDVDEKSMNPWPQCPGHPHPMTPELIQGVAKWACPRDQRPVATIGTLADR